MENKLKKLKSIIIIFFAAYVQILFAQKSVKTIGTIGNEKMGKENIVICVYGTKACMPVKIDTSMTVKFQGKETKLTELPFGLYLEADIVSDSINRKLIRNISIDETKTVICFTELKKKQETKLSELLGKIKGVKGFELRLESSQVYIEYNPKIIAYKDLERKIAQEGFELE